LFNGNFRIAIFIEVEKENMEVGEEISLLEMSKAGES